MSEPLGIFADILAAVIIMFALPLVVCVSLADELEADYIKIAADEFTSDICRFGYLDEERYSSFASGIRGRHKWKISVEGAFDRYEPVYADGAFTGEVTSYESYIPESAIMDEINRNGKYQFRNDDRVWVRVYCEDLIGHDSYGRITGVCR